LRALTAFFIGGMTMKAELKAVDNVNALVNRTSAIIDLLNNPLGNVGATIPYTAETLHAAFWQVKLNLQEIDSTVNRMWEQNRTKSGPNA
jgi:hypothetical protein